MESDILTYENIIKIILKPDFILLQIIEITNGRKLENIKFIC